MYYRNKLNYYLYSYYCKNNIKIINNYNMNTFFDINTVFIAPTAETASVVLSILVSIIQL